MQTILPARVQTVEETAKTAVGNAKDTLAQAIAHRTTQNSVFESLTTPGAAQASASASQVADLAVSGANTVVDPLTAGTGRNFTARLQVQSEIAKNAQNVIIASLPTSQAVFIPPTPLSPMGSSGPSSPPQVWDVLIDALVPDLAGLPAKAEEEKLRGRLEPFGVCKTPGDHLTALQRVLGARTDINPATAETGPQKRSFSLLLGKFS